MHDLGRLLLFGSVNSFSELVFFWHVTLTACGGSAVKKKATEKSEDGKTKLTVTTWNYDTTPEFEKLFRAFEAENPDITIEPVDIASDDYDTKVTTMLSSGDTTDILTMKTYFHILITRYAINWWI